MINDFGFKELYEVSLKATYPIEVGGNTIEPGEIIALFDKIQIANFTEIKNVTTARGGFDNRAQIIWETPKEVKINFTQGVFSKIQFALMSNAQLVENLGEEEIVLDARTNAETDEEGKVIIEKEMTAPVFVYDTKTGKKLTDWTREGNTIITGNPYQEITVDYRYAYANGYTVMKIGKALTASYLSLTGKTRVKDDTTGKVVTGIIKIPKLRLMSDLSIRVGNDAIPQIGRVDAIAVPEGARGQQKIMEIIFLNDDIDADM